MYDFETILLKTLKHAGVRLITGYPGYPVSSLLMRLSDANGASQVFKWTVNERVALEMCMGASFSGARTMAVMKSHGMNTVIDQLVNFVYLGVRGGMVLLVGDDMQIRASQNRTDSRLYGPLVGVPVFEPGTPADFISHLSHIFTFSEQWDTPVLCRFTEQMLDRTTDIEPVEDAPILEPCEFIRDTNKYLLGPLNFHRKKKKFDKRLIAIREQSQSCFNTLELKSRKRGIIVSGTFYEEILADNPDASILKVVLSYPICMAEVRRLIDYLTIKKIYLAEISADLIRAQILPWCQQHGIVLEDATSKRAQDNESSGVDVSLCPACPHRAVLIALKELDLDVMGDAGCSALGYFPPLRAIHCQASLGASIGMACGVNAVASKTAVALIGDSSFYHGGINALLQASTYDSDVLVIILDNGIAAMTGGQPSAFHNPQSGNTQIDWQLLCTACGIPPHRIAITRDVFNVRRIREFIQGLCHEPGTKVLILQGACTYQRDHKRSWTKIGQEAPGEALRRPAEDRLPYTRQCPAYQTHPTTGKKMMVETLCGPCRICCHEADCVT